MVVRDQPHTASVGMHQGNAEDLPDDTKRWISNLPRAIHLQDLDLLRQNSEVRESQSGFGRGQRAWKPSSREGNTNFLRLRIRGGDCILEF